MADATLNDVVDELKSSNKEEEKTSKSVKSLSDAFGFWMKGESAERQRIRLDKKEREREKAAARKAEKLKARQELTIEENKALAEIAKGTFLGTMVSNFLRGFAKPLMKIGKFFLRRSPLILAISSLLWVFEDIGKHPDFKKTVDRLSTVYADDVIPSLEKLREALSKIGFETGELAEFLDNKLKPILQEGVIGLLDDTITMIKRFFNGMSDILEGEYLKGFTSIGIIIPEVILNTMDNLATVLAKTLLASSGIEAFEGRLSSFVAEWSRKNFGGVFDWFDRVGNRIVRAIEATKEGAVKTADFTNNVFSTVNTFLSNTYQNVKSGLESAENEIDEMVEKFQNTYNSIIDGYTKMVDWVKDLPYKVLDYVNSLIPDKLDFLRIDTPTKLEREKASAEAKAKPIVEIVDVEDLVVPKISVKGFEISEQRQAAANVDRNKSDTTAIVVDNSNKSTNSSSQFNFMGSLSPWQTIGPIIDP